MNQPADPVRALRDRIAVEHAKATQNAAADHSTPEASHVHDGIAAGLEIALRLADQTATTATDAVRELERLRRQLDEARDALRIAEGDRYAADTEREQLRAQLARVHALAADTERRGGHLLTLARLRDALNPQEQP